MPVASESGAELHLLEPDDFDSAEELELSLAESRTVRVVYYLLLAGALLVIVLVLLLTMAMQSDAMTLNISAHVIGSGLMNSSYTGDSLNVSLMQNATGLNISVVGGAA
jgi:hypothetical protein